MIEMQIRDWDIIWQGDPVIAERNGSSGCCDRGQAEEVDSLCCLACGRSQTLWTKLSPDLQESWGGCHKDCTGGSKRSVLCDSEGQACKYRYVSASLFQKALKKAEDSLPPEVLGAVDNLHVLE